MKVVQKITLLFLQIVLVLSSLMLATLSAHAQQPTTEKQTNTSILGAWFFTIQTYNTKLINISLQQNSCDFDTTGLNYGTCTYTLQQDGKIMVKVRYKNIDGLTTIILRGKYDGSDTITGDSAEVIRITSATAPLQKFYGNWRATRLSKQSEADSATLSSIEEFTTEDALIGNTPPQDELILADLDVDPSDTPVF